MFLSILEQSQLYDCAYSANSLVQITGHCHVPC